MLKDPELDNPWSNQSKKFRRRFRVTYKLFLFIVKLFKDVNLFNTTRNSAVPVELKILIGLRMLGRGNYTDDISEMSGIPVSSVYRFFMFSLISLVHSIMIHLLNSHLVTN